MFDQSLLQETFARAQPFAPYVATDPSKAPNFWQVHACNAQRETVRAARELHTQDERAVLERNVVR